MPNLQDCVVPRAGSADDVECVERELARMTGIC
jgi:hypothetical protein